MPELPKSSVSVASDVALGGGSFGGGSSAAAPSSTTATSVRPAHQAPLRKLTTSLLTTYKLINTKYYAAKKERAARVAAAGARTESANADYQVVANDRLGANGRYRVIESLGKGSFGQVVSAEDMQEHCIVAVKVIKARDAFRRQAKSETKLLEKLNKQDTEDQWCIGEARADSTRASFSTGRALTLLIYFRAPPPYPPLPLSRPHQPVSEIQGHL